MILYSKIKLEILVQKIYFILSSLVNITIAPGCLIEFALCGNKPRLLVSINDSFLNKISRISFSGNVIKRRHIREIN